MLATNMFFWTWSGAPVHLPPVVIPPASRGIGHRKGSDNYQPLTEEEWQAREEKIRASLPPTPTPETIVEKRMRYAQSLRLYQQHEQQLVSMRTQLAATIEQLRKSSNPEELKQLADTVKQLRIAVGNLDNQHRAHLIQLKSQHFQLLH